MRLSLLTPFPSPYHATCFLKLPAVTQVLSLVKPLPSLFAHYSSASLHLTFLPLLSSLLIKLLPTPKHLPLFLPSSLLLPFLLHRALGCSPANCPTSHSLWTLDAPLPSFPLGKILSPSSHSPSHSTSSILFSTQSSLPNKSPHHPTFDSHPSLCPSMPLCCPHHLLRLDP